MKTFLIDCLCVLLIVAGVDLAYRVLCRHIYEHDVPADCQLSGMYAYQFAHDSVDMAVIGASTALYHYDEQRMSDSLGIRVANVSYEFMGMPYIYLCLERIVKDNPPQVVILDLNAAQFEREANIDSYYRYLPYYWANPTVRQVVDQMIGAKHLLCYSALYQYNSSLRDIRRRYTRNEHHAGFIALPTNNHRFAAGERTTFEPIPLAEEYLKRSVRLCKDRHIFLIICHSPNLLQDSGFTDYMNAIASEYQLPFWNFDKLPSVCSDTNNFYDDGHLNGIGAQIYTDTIIGRLHTIHF
ncbi:MAG: hypothetical protein IJ680_06845 [Paludibacteraceae bacterium]|nr:hypothetical protein [Paludibacteraceae bacterium]